MSRFALRSSLRALLLSGGLMLGLVLGTGTSTADLQNRIDAARSSAGALRSTIAAQDAQISQTSGSVQAAQAHLDTMQATLDARVHQLQATRGELQRARDRLVVLENRMRDSTQALADNLRAEYEGARPNLMTVILQARGFADLLEQVDFLQRVGRQDAGILAGTRAARRAVAAQAVVLVRLESRDQALADQILTQRNQVAALHAALLRREIAQLAGRAQDTARLHALNAQLGSLQAQAVAQARRAAAAAAAAAAGGATGNGGGNGTGTPAAGLATNSGGMAQPPPGAPGAVAQVMAAGNAIATLPYVWGGGHGSFQASGYDCSGSVSYALAAAGLLSSPLDSTGFESWGQPGPGRWITVYANAGHAFMVVGGWRFDTVALASGGTRWTQTMTDTSGFVARHPAGL
jgi:peptidoglycan hydrolase CwlO-like protein